MTLDELGGEGLSRERTDHFAEFGQLGERGQRRDVRLCRREQRIGRGTDWTSWWRDVLAGFAKARQTAQVDARTVIRQQQIGGWFFLVAGVVGGQREEFILVAGLALIDGRGIGGLALPDLEVAIVGGDIHRGMAQAGAQGFIGHLPTHFIVAAARLQLRGGQRGDRRLGIQGLHQLFGVLRRKGVEQHARLRRNGRAGGQFVLRLDAVAELADAGARRVVRRQQAAGSVLHHFAGFRVDRLEHPGSGRTLRIDTGGDAQDEALGVDEIEIALEQRAVGRDVHCDIAQLDIAQAEAERIQRRVDLRQNADFGNRAGRRRRVFELHGVRQGLIHRQELLRAIALRAGNGGQLTGLDRLLIEAREVEHGQLVGRVDRSEIRQGDGHRGGARLREADIGYEDIEGFEVGRMRQLLVVVGELGQGRHWNLAFHAIALARLVMVNLGQFGRIAAVPLDDLVEELQQITIGDDLITCRADQYAGRQRTHQALHFDVHADRRRFVDRPDDLGLFQRGDVGIGPGVRIGGQGTQRQRGALYGQRGRVGAGRVDLGLKVNIFQDAGTDRQRLGALLGDEFVARHRGRRGDDVEAIRDERENTLVRQAFFRVRQFPETPVRVEQRMQRIAFQALHRLRPAGQFLLGLQLRVGFIETDAHGVPILGGEGFQQRVGLDVERVADIAAGDHVIGIALGQDLAGGIDRRVEAGPRHIFQRVVGCAAQVVVVVEEVEVINIFVLAHLGHAELELHIRGVDVGQALQRHAIDAGLAGRQHARAAEADGDIGFQRPFDQEAVGLDGLVAVRIDDLDVVQAMRRLAEIEGGADPGGIEHFVADRLVLGDAGTHQLEDGVLGRRIAVAELGAAHVDGDPAAVAALVDMDAADGEGHHLGQQLHRGVVAGFAMAADQHIVIARLGGGDHGSLVGLQRILITGVVVVTVRHGTVAQEYLVGSILVRRGQPHAQGFALVHGELVDPALAGAERGVFQHAKMQFVDRYRQRIRRGGVVVEFTRRAVYAFENLVEDVRPHDDTVLPRRGGRQ